ncbi:methylmalonyl-CoA mutase family protein [Allonocardiopsis opalescens]|uniref:methylmalonyl-CoA mutase n=1 Tax=Allonocardiopsis opalescens TaxID=1144618 RepID=A0A2T0PTW8_9ACTN|nr:methylmalonyl-CoA mutase family protein [Allonocardiopsis opalescens]PRX92166.1 heterodimeric methylmalonyl-CoA mutase small subunit [Allonocardiopsis opalescens]
MAEHLPDTPLAEGFPPATRERWRALAAAALRRSGTQVPDEPSSAVEELLTHRTRDGIALRPLYTAGDVSAGPGPGVPGLAPYLRGGRPEGAAAQGWEVRQLHDHAETGAARAAVLADLENGATALWLRVGPAHGAFGADRLGDALDGVLLDLAPVHLDAGHRFAEAADAYLALCRRQGLPDGEVAGGLGADPLGLRARTGVPGDMDAAAELARRAHAHHPRLRALTVDALPYHDAGASEAKELGAALAAGVGYLRALTGAGLSVQAAAGQLEFRYAATADQFLTMAKLRAARLLWARATAACGAPAAAQRQHAVTSAAMMAARDPWTNLLRTTVAAFAAGTAGADAVTVLPFDTALGDSDAFARRIARNTQTLLLEESHLGRVIDPAGGSWYLEALTAELARAAWAWFQRVERAGGLAAALDSGMVGGELAADRRRRAEDVAHGRERLVGVGDYPDLDERPVRRPARAPADAPRDPARALPRYRPAAPFEELRERSDRRLAATGARPAVFLATLGPVAAHGARADYAAGLLAAGGLAATRAGATRTPAEVLAAYRGEAVACLCGDDDRLAEQTAEVAAGLRAAGARLVLAAVPPPERPGDGGPDGHVFPGCDALAALHRIWQEVETA